MKFSLKNLKSEKTFSRHIWQGGAPTYMNPVRDWTVGLAVAALVFPLGGILIAYDFYQQFGAPGEVVSVEEQPVVYQEKEVVRYAELYTEKEREFNALRKGRVYVPPPVVEVEVTGEPLAE